MKKKQKQMAKSSPPSAENPNNLTIAVREGSDVDETAAKFLLGPFVSNAYVSTRFGKPSLGEIKLDNAVKSLVKSAAAVKENNLAEVEELLTSQAKTLNIMFAELARRSAANMGEYLEASQRYMNMALKAQNQCRMTLETLSNIKNPPVVYAKQANIANGPQQVNNGTMPPRAHANEKQNQPNKLLEASSDQALDTGSPGTAGDSDKAMATMGEIDRTKNP